MTKLKRWFSRAWGWLVGIATILLAGIGLYSYHRAKVRELGRVKDDLALQRATEEVRALRKVREEIAKEVEADDGRLRRLDAELARNARDIVEAHEGGQGLSDEEVLDAFARLGI